MNMEVSEADRRALARQQRVLADHEEAEEATGTARQRAIEDANVWRRQHDIAPLRDESDRPELELHELARSRGLLPRIR